MKKYDELSCDEKDKLDSYLRLEMLNTSDEAFAHNMTRHILNVFLVLFGLTVIALLFLVDMFIKTDSELALEIFYDLFPFSVFTISFGVIIYMILTGLIFYVMKIRRKKTFLAFDIEKVFDDVFEITNEDIKTVKVGFKRKKE